jgi:hypothetical protein
MATVAEFRRDLRAYLYAGFGGIWVQTFEFDDFISVLRHMIGEGQMRDKLVLGVWSLDRGLEIDATTPLGQALAAHVEAISQSKDRRRYIANLRALLDDLAELTAPGPTLLLVLRNVHFKEIMQNSLHLQQLERAVNTAKKTAIGDAGFRLIFQAPEISVPLELRSITSPVLSLPLPNKDEIEAITREVCGSDIHLTDAQIDEIWQTARGMTRSEYENAAALCLTQCREIQPERIWQMKARNFLREGFVRLEKSEGGFERIGGYGGIKRLAKAMLRPQPDPLLRPRGLILVGVPGAGKSSTIRAMANECGRPVVWVSMGRLRDKFQGESDKNMARLLASADAMEPIILAIDEVEKALAGSTASAAESDAGTGARIFGELLDWLERHTSDVVVVATCNNLDALPQEFRRTGRFDFTFFFDLPSAESRREILKLYVTMYKLYPEGKESWIDEIVDAHLADTEGMVGSDIFAWCRITATMRAFDPDVKLKDTRKLVVSAMQRDAQAIVSLQEAAHMRYLDAETGTLYTKIRNVSTLEKDGRRAVKKS